MATSRPDVLPQYNYVHAEQPVPSPEETESIFDPFEDEFPMRFVNFKQQFKVYRILQSNAHTQILEPAGAASDSPVLRVHDNDMEMECALKVLSKRQILNRGWKSVEQTNQEARILV
ncbi:unnamed protein product [Echinostoma caproni]|uniref:RanBD1 domain-containing protein n=1 Tax=Echinostoma caproni TaxID=27848 RepID=A0A183AD66_9TREM|nr:unnamed protein product [Echinostoma caproni]